MDYGTIWFISLWSFVFIFRMVQYYMDDEPIDMKKLKLKEQQKHSNHMAPLWALFGTIIWVIFMCAIVFLIPFASTVVLAG